MFTYIDYRYDIAIARRCIPFFYRPFGARVNQAVESLKIHDDMRRRVYVEIIDASGFRTESSAAL